MEELGSTFRHCAMHLRQSNLGRRRVSLVGKSKKAPKDPQSKSEKQAKDNETGRRRYSVRKSKEEQKTGRVQLARGRDENLTRGIGKGGEGDDKGRDKSGHMPGGPDTRPFPPPRVGGGEGTREGVSRLRSRERDKDGGAREASGGRRISKECSGCRPGEGEEERRQRGSEVGKTKRSLRKNTNLTPPAGRR